MLNITLPKIATAGKNEFKGTVTIGIDNKEQISFNGKDVADDQLLPLLKNVSENYRDIPVPIKADQTTQLQKLTFVMDSCQLAGAT